MTPQCYQQNFSVVAFVDFDLLYVKVSLSSSCFCIEKCLLHLFYVRYCSIFKCFLNSSFNSAKVTELPPVWERAANSAYHL